MSSLKKDLLSSDFIINPSTDVNKLYDQYHNTFSSLLDKHAPTINKKIDKPTPTTLYLPPNVDTIQKQLIMQKIIKKKLWKELKSLLHKNPASVLPEPNSSKCFADPFADFFINKITRIRSPFSNQGSYNP